jgi:predicted phosphohydrolase
MTWLDELRRDLVVAELRGWHRDNPQRFWEALAEEDRALLEPMIERLRIRMAKSVIEQKAD